MNELLLGVEAAICALFVLLTWRYAPLRLPGVIALFLILITIVGGKLITVLGHTTNTGNIFYASIYLATYFLIERMGKREGVYATWLSVVAVAFFFAFIQVTVAFTGASQTAHFNTVLQAVYEPFSRITAAALIAYVLSQNINVYLYTYLKTVFRGNNLWLRANTANTTAQIVDSLVFFNIAFWGVVAPGNIYDIILTGFALKVAFVAVTSPLLYLNRIEQDESHDGPVIAMR